MNALPKIDMIEATRLTREGRLEDAMAVLRGALPGAPSSTGADDIEADTRNKPARRALPFLDMVPPSPGTGGVWTSPSPEEPSFASRSSGTGPAKMPEALRDLMDRMGSALPTGGLGGMPGPTTGRISIAVPQGAKFEERTYANAAGSRAYKLYIPSGYTGQAVPLVVMLHGCTQSPDDFAAGTRMNELAEEQTFLVAYPAQTQAANMSKCWNWFSAGDQQRDQGEPSLIAGITREIMQDFSVEHGRVYIAGLSAGGAAAAIMGATYPDLYAAVGVHSGLACGAASDMPSAFAAMKQGGSVATKSRSRQSRSARAVPTIVFHGDRDTTVNPINGDQVVAQARASADLETTMNRGQSTGGMSYTCTRHSDASGRGMLEQWVLHGAGHAWSGGSSVGSYTDARGPDASREMMRFFRQHSTAAVAQS
jgi:poly(hydroxyalkanoate) depolymerase family esterase